MKNLGLLLVLMVLGTVPIFAENPLVDIQTSAGKITIELYPDKAPESVKNFLSYVDEKFYSNTIFHRVIDNFMIQGGGFTVDMKQKQTHDPIKNEAGNGLRNDTGTIAMARTRIVDSATAQFFINVSNNAFLNHRDESIDGFGYCVFGKVIHGMEIVDAIKKVKTGTLEGFQNVPKTPVVIEKIERVTKSTTTDSN